MRNWKVGLRLSLAFGLLLGLMVLAVGVALVGIRGAEEQASRMESESVALLDAANAMRVAQLGEAVAIRDFVSLSDVASQKQALGALRASEKAYADATAELRKVAAALADQAIAQQATQLDAIGRQLAGRMKQALDLSDNAEYQQAQTLVYTEVRPLQATTAAALEKLVQHAKVLAVQRAQSAAAQAVASEQRLLAAVAAALVLGVIATVAITRSIVHPLRSAVHAAERVAGGDLTHLRIAIRRDETGRVLIALAGMQERLNALVRTIRDGAHAVSRASEQIAAGNTDLAARTEEQAASLEETAASVEELTASVKQNSEHAGKASELARSAADLAAGGGSAVDGMVESMQGIHKSSRKVADIVGLMDDLAFQTNLLALNAAVEAARAGDQGRGFAVVAAQVRVLAQRSAEASKDIKQLVNDAVAQADQGTKAASRAGDAMGKVVRVAREVADVVAHIARATDEQRTGIEQVNGTIAQLEGVTQSNAGLVQEINALTETLLAEARAQVEAASRFRLEDGEDPAGAAQAGRPALEVPMRWEAISRA
ncbi:MAG TPA: methyl-accepting chemotaxis protein [Ramlibacter sp.]|nr:methyl-accepting chemotaxis protein [Ramlibacter sp.]